jgi:predicted SprT family Zn-dependent metalloprotease
MGIMLDSIMVARMTNKTVRELIHFTCKCNGCPEAANLIWFEWSNRMTVTMGRVEGNAGSYHIKLSAKLFAHIDEEEQRDTVIHETCHAIDNYINKKRMSHGEGWRECMRLAGQEPRRCHNGPLLVKRFIYTCPCSDFKVSTRMHNLINKGSRRACPKCNKVVSFTGQVEGV